MANWTRFCPPASVAGAVCKSAMDNPSGGKPAILRYGGCADRLRPRSGFEELRERPGTLERRQVVVAADVLVADVDLRDGTAAGARHHLLALAGIGVDADLGDVRDALRREQSLRLQTIGTDARGVHRDRLAHRGLVVSVISLAAALIASYFARSTGKPASRHARKPPLR